MKTFISLCLILLVTLSNSRYVPTAWGTCYPVGPNEIWLPRSVDTIQDPNLKEVITISANGFVNNLGYYVDFQNLLVNGTNGDYNWSSTTPYFHRIVGYGKYLALNYTTYIPDLNQTNMNVTMRALGPNGNVLGCVNIALQNQTEISI